MQQPSPTQRVPVKLEEEMQKSYMDYAMSVIVGRAELATTSGGLTGW